MGVPGFCGLLRMLGQKYLGTRPNSPNSLHLSQISVLVVGSAVATTNYSSALVCAAASSRASTAGCSSKEGSDLYYGMFALAMFIAGAGCTPMISLGIPYMDESVSKENSPLYIGLFQTSGIFGKFCLTVLFI